MRRVCTSVSVAGGRPRGKQKLWPGLQRCRIFPLTVPAGPTSHWLLDFSFLFFPRVGSLLKLFHHRYHHHHHHCYHTRHLLLAPTTLSHPLGTPAAKVVAVAPATSSSSSSLFFLPVLSSSTRSVASIPVSPPATTLAETSWGKRGKRTSQHRV